MVKESSSLAVNVKGVHKQFHQGGVCIDALKDVSLQAHTSELLMIVGPSGCGKTTLLSVIAGTLFFDQGEIDLFGHALHQLTEKEITRFRRQYIGFIFQQYHLIPTLNCLENVTIPLLLNAIPSSEVEQRAVAALEKVGLKGREKEDPRKLSGGQQQRVAIARALVHEPRLVICDEPTAALDADNGLRVMDLMKEIAYTTNRCMLIVTHDMRLKEQLTRLESIEDRRAVSQEELHTRRCDVTVATAQLEAAEAQLKQTTLLIERLNICAPQQGDILQSNIRKGEFVVAGGAPGMILGDIKHLQVRAEIDEQNASDLIPHTHATAFPKNNSTLKIPLHFERIEPYVIPKRSLTGSSDERVDTRVLQVIYSFDKLSTFPLYVGQQVDIFIEHPETKTIAHVQEKPAYAP